MTDRIPQPPKARTSAEERQRRQAEALRANLARRKQQSRERALSEQQPEPELAPEQGNG